MWELKSAVLEVLVAGLASWAFYRAKDGPSRPLFPAAIPLVSLSVWMILSVAWSVDRVAGFEQAVFFLWIVVLLVYLRPNPSTPFPAWIIAGLALVEAGAGAVQANGAATTRISGLFVSANHHAALLLCGYAVTAVYAVTARRTMAAAWAVAASFILLASASMSGSRTVVPAAIAVVAVLLVSRPRGFGRGKAAILLVASVAALLAPQGVAGRVAGQAAGLEPLPFGRLDLWGACLRMLEASPLAGTGIGGFADSYFAFRPVVLAKLSAEYAHCEPLQLACETGLIGLGLAIWVLWVFWKARPRFIARGLSALRGRDRGREAGPTGPALLMPLIPLAVFSAVDFPLRDPVLAFLAVGILASWGVGDGGAGKRRPGTGLLPVCMFFLVSAFMVSWFVAGHLAAWRFTRGARLSSEGKNREALKSFESALAVFPPHAESLHAIAELAPSRKDAGVLLARAAALRPMWTPPLATSFEAYMRNGNARMAESALYHARRIDPYGLSTMLMGVRWAESRGDWAGAQERLAEADRLWPNHLDVWLEKARLLESRRDIAGCRALLKKILVVFPDNVAVKEWLQRLPW